MKKYVILAFCLALFLGFSGVASAIPYTDTYDAGPDGPWGLLMGWPGVSSHSWTFDITDDGYNPATQDVSSASVRLHFSERDWDFIWSETAQLDVGSNTFTWEVDTGWSNFSISSLMSLNEFGTVDATMTATDGNFWFNQADLYAEGSDPDPGSISPAPVPEPATMLLLGTGLVGIAGVSRKKLLKKK